MSVCTMILRLVVKNYDRIFHHRSWIFYHWTIHQHHYGPTYNYICMYTADSVVVKNQVIELGYRFAGE